MSKNKLKIKSTREWGHFFDGYLEMSLVACDSIIEKSNKKDKKIQEEIEKIYFPILFNIKHSIELLIKTLDFIYFEKKIIDSSDKTHNLEELFSCMKDKVSVKELQNELDNFIKLIKGEDFKHFFEEAREKMPSFWSDLEMIIKKYTQLDFLKDKIKDNYFIYDLDNTAFKYPTNSLSIQLDYSKILENINVEDIEDIIKDINKLKNLGFWLWYSVDSLIETKKTKKHGKK